MCTAAAMGVVIVYAIVWSYMMGMYAGLLCMVYMGVGLAWYIRVGYMDGI